jgi:LPXTG-site transpeptidase (sortase) family protein
MKQKRTFLFSITMIVMLVSSLVFQVTPAAAAAGINQDFRSGSASGWNLSGSATLTSGGADPVGDGWLRLTSTTMDQAGSAIYNSTAFPSSGGLQVSFSYASYGGTGADGFTFYLIDGSTVTPTVGGTGGALGYAWKHTTTVNEPGVTNGYVGIGFDEYGNFANDFDTNANPYGTGGYATGTTPGITVRGPGNLFDAGSFPYRTRANMTIATGSRAGAKNVTITITSTHLLTVVVDGTTYISSVDIGAMPTTFKMGFSASTGGSTNYHEIRDLTVTGLTPSTTTVVTSGSPSVIGNSVTFTATVTGGGATPTGNVAFYRSATYLGTSALDGAGVATYPTSALGLGAHTITAKYLGDSTYAVSKGMVGQTVIACSAPTITSLSIVAGPLGGGTGLTITGTNFYSTGDTCAPTGVTFGGAAGTSFVVTSPTTANIITPTALLAGVPAGGQVNVVVTGSPAGSSAPLVKGFVYVPPPTINNYNLGRDAGGLSITLTGTNFASNYGVGANWEVDSVTIGGNGTVCPGPNNATTLTCTTPANTIVSADADLVNVRVTTPGGDTLGLNGGSGGTGAYLYVPPPTISTLSLDIGPTTGGSPVVITGTYFKSLAPWGPYAITWTTNPLTFGGTPPSSYTVNSATQITTTTPAHVPGTVSVAATTPGGTTAPNTLFTYVQGSDLGVEPNYGPAAGGTTVILRGHGFTGTTGFLFGGSSATCTVNSDVQITCTTPAHASGLVEIILSGGPSGTRNYPNAFNYIPNPVAGVTPSTGPTNGGTTVTITGTNFSAATGVTFGGASAASFTIVDATHITAVTPPHSAGTVNVNITGGTPASFASAFTFVPPQFYADIYPNYGPVFGGTSVTITGVGFTGATAVTFGGTSATSFVVNSDTVITAVTPVHVAGMVDVVVTRPSGPLNYVNSFTFTGTNLPLAPASVPANSVHILETNSPNQLSITFNMDMIHVGSGDPNWASSALNPANYMLVGEGSNEIIETETCLGGPRGDDLVITINSVASYDPKTFTVVLNVNNGYPLPVHGVNGTIGDYRLFACGTTSIRNLAGVKLNGGLDDTRFNFTIDPVAALPATGFAPDRVTALPVQPASQSYAGLGDFWLEIPRLGVQMSIVGIPQSGNTWDVSWLGSNAGWLQGTAFPTWNGNSVITGHVWNADNTAGPFIYLNTLWYGDRIIIHAWGQQYTYEVRSVMQVRPDSVTAAFAHKATPWLTLTTCRSWDANSGTYRYRVLVQAVLVDVK